MSESEATKAELDEHAAFAKLDAAVGRLLDERGRLAARVMELESLLERMKSGDSDPVKLQEAFARVEMENDDLKRRIREGRQGVDRLLSRLRFLESQR